MSHGRVVCVDAVDAHGVEGLLADARSLGELGCEAAFVPTAILVHATSGVVVTPIPPSGLETQLVAVLAGERVPVVRTGILGGRETVERVAARVVDAGVPGVVVAPLARVAGSELLESDELDATRDRLFPIARVVVLRFAELARWGAGDPRSLDEVRDAARLVRARGARAVLISGWIEGSRVFDVLDDAGAVTVLDAARVPAPRVPGLSSAHATVVAARLAGGVDLVAAAAAAQRYVGSRLRRAR